MLTPKTNRRRLGLSILIPLIGVILCGAYATYYVYHSVDASVMASIQVRTETIASALDAESVEALAGNESDLDSEWYQKLKERMIAIHEVNKDSRFVYLMGRNDDGRIFFYVDSEDPSSEDYSPPGQVYFEASNALKAVFTDEQSGIEVASDRWGDWISGFAPVIDPVSGRAVAVAGIDIDMHQHLPTLLAYSSLPFLATLILLLILAITYQIRRSEERRIDERAELLAIASHEIRSPLTGIRWAADALLNGSEPLSESVRHRVGSVYESALLIIDRINNLLAVNALEAKHQKLKLGPVAIRPLIDDTMHMLNLVAEQKGLTIDVSPALRADVHVHGDLEKMRTLFTNLISNAVKYGKPGTPIEIGYREEAGRHILTVSNSGDGIPEEDIPFIFTGYYRARNVAGHTDGTGMGLFLAKKIVDMHNGKITVASVEHGKTTFTLSFPKAKGDTKPEPASTTP